LRLRPASRPISGWHGLVLLPGGQGGSVSEDDDPCGHHEQRRCLAGDLRRAAGEFLVQQEPGQADVADRVGPGATPKT
jgi:hypothetical protein